MSKTWDNPAGLEAQGWWVLLDAYEDLEAVTPGGIVLPGGGQFKMARVNSVGGHVANPASGLSVQVGDTVVVNPEAQAGVICGLHLMNGANIIAVLHKTQEVKLAPVTPIKPDAA